MLSVIRVSQIWTILFNCKKILISSMLGVQIQTYCSVYLKWVSYSNPISRIDTHRDLGIMISSDLSWEAHYNNINSKAYKMLGLLRRSFTSNIHVSLYISMVHSQLLFCSVLWKPHLLKNINAIERIQRWATKYILNDYSSDYKTCLIKLKILPLMYTFDINDVMFLIKSIKFPSEAFNITNFATFISGNTQLANNNKLQHTRSSNIISNNF